MVDLDGGAPLQLLLPATTSEFPVFVPAGVAESEVVSRTVEDVYPSEPAPSTVSPAVPIPHSRRDMQFSPPHSLSVRLRYPTSLW